MPYDITTIGSMFGSCTTCGADKTLDVKRMGDVIDVAKEIANRVNPFSDQWFVKQLAAKAAAAAEAEAEAAQAAAQQAAKAAGKTLIPNTLPTMLDIAGVPTWGYQKVPIVVGTVLAVAAAGAGTYYVLRKRKARASAGKKKA